MRLQKFLGPALLAVFVVFLALRSMAGVYADWLWFGETGFQQIFLRILGTQVALGAGAFVVALAVLYANVRIAQRSMGKREFTVYGPEGARTVAFDMGSLKPLFLIGSLIASALLASYAAAQWDVWLMSRNAVAFGTTDPILGHDVGFYVFHLPLLHALLSFALATTVLAALGVGLAHFASQNLMLDPVQGLRMSDGARRHLAVLAAILLLLLAFRAWLGLSQLMVSPSGIVHGASYVDVKANMPVQWVLIVVASLGALLALWQTRTTRLWPIMAAAGGYLAVVLAGQAYAIALQKLVVGPNEQVSELPYIRHSIAATRVGFALDKVEERQLSGEATLTAADIDRNRATFDNVPLWNEQPLLDTFGQLQEIRTYYDFASVDNDRYVIDGEYRQIMLSAREMNSDALPSGTWINERLTFTHGYGLTLGPVNEVTPEGLPVLFIKDLPLSSSVDLKVDQPGIYFGELSNDHVFVKTDTAEFDYPKGDDNVFGSYEGTGGIPIDSLWRRLLFAIQFGAPEVLFSPAIIEGSRVLMYRRIAERVRRIAPFLTYDPDPYLAISGGRLIWVQDAYTTSTRYPYSTPSAGINYIRNSVKVTIDAYDGTVVYHIVDTEDPVAATLARVFPDLFRPLDAMPDDLRNRLRYPQGIFSLQAAVFATFHMTSPDTFYNREDQWDIPSLDAREGGQQMSPYYTIMKLPGGDAAEFIQMLPYTPRQKDNLAAWMVARSDGGNYGQLIVFQLPKQTVVFGPRQISARISQDEVIAPQITLWDQQGSEVIQGTLLVIPIEESLVYIRPLYLRAAGGRIPELKRVVVAYRNRIVMEESLDVALARLFPGSGSDRPRAPVPARGDSSGTTTAAAAATTGASGSGAGAASGLAAQAQRQYQQAMQAQRAGNWALYGEEVKKLGETLERLRAEQP
jgi:uncharacterized membrane protein (UPF0182 family)